MIYKLDVPYQKKDKAKSFGARWDSAEHTWYYEGDELPADFVCPICKHGAADFEKI